VAVNLFVSARRLPDTRPPQALLILENIKETVRLCREQQGQ
jgi:hypothetical protein